MNQSDKRSRFFLIAALVAAAIGVVLLIKWPRKTSLRIPRGQAGLTLLETLLAVAIIGLIGTGVVKAIDTNARAGRVLDEKVQAVNLATDYFEVIRQLPYSNNSTPYSNAGDNITIPHQYSVTINAEYSADGTTWVPTHTDQTLQKITVSVFRTGGRLVFSTCTLRSER
jgi:Tfp pilus assembly protein PilV